MGGSAIGGDLTRVLAEPEARVPITVIRDYNLPRYVGRDTLVLASSFSGSTEETLSACEQALRVGARVVAITTGGTLAERARSAGFPLIQFSFDGQPREAIGYSTLLMVGALVRLGYIGDCTTQVEAAAGLLQRLGGEIGPEVPTESNRAKRLAQRLFGRIPVVYGGGLMAAVARRWKSQINENAKQWAFFEHLPELNHNAVLGYQFPTDVANRVFVVLLSSSLSHPRIRARERATSELLGRWGVTFEMLAAEGSSPVEHLYSATYFGDFVSYYLALVNDVDPSNIDTIIFLKARLAQVADRAQSN
jgi:glucose/mannose-6-phosphate isomerase